MSIYSKFRQFLTCTKASSAIEFALVVPIFLTMVFAIFEVGYVFLTDLALESSLSNASRLIRTGQSHEAKTTEAQFKKLICDGAYGLINCDKLTVVADEFDSFSDGSSKMPPLFKKDGSLKKNSLFDIGGSDSIIVVRTTYVYDILNPFGSVVKFSNYGDNKYLQVHIVAFKNEPFS